MVFHGSENLSSSLGCIFDNAQFMLKTTQTSEAPQIKPRRKSKDLVKSNTHEPVVVTLDILHDLEEYPLGVAAAKLGVSATAFKKACRKLGVKRWSYTKHGSYSGIYQRKISKISYGTEHIKQMNLKFSHTTKIVAESSLDFPEISSPCRAEKVTCHIGLSTSWVGPDERSSCLSGLSEKGLAQIFDEEMKVDDECAMSLLSSIWRARSNQTPGSV